MDRMLGRVSAHVEAYFRFVIAQALAEKWHSIVDTHIDDFQQSMLTDGDGNLHADGFRRLAKVGF
jgi:hypothetical protein